MERRTHIFYKLQKKTQFFLYVFVVLLLNFLGKEAIAQNSALHDLVPTSGQFYNNASATVVNTQKIAGTTFSLYKCDGRVIHALPSDESDVTIPVGSLPITNSIAYQRIK